MTVFTPSLAVPNLRILKIQHWSSVTAGRGSPLAIGSRDRSPGTQFSNNSPVCSSCSMLALRDSPCPPGLWLPGTRSSVTHFLSASTLFCPLCSTVPISTALDDPQSSLQNAGQVHSMVVTFHSITVSLVRVHRGQKIEHMFSLPHLPVLLTI